ncbi:LysM peptidoglycan-binding domain-containing protein [Flammeovirgaceae bacterium SG7u.111]|nr:LysM peptidoglycan-binding domain-containing protein [Flammeovirgaceae bacterium SG7u.132]WPO35622.1 LysM peptidoglycan-binding domain-containing protein [Flammeovirgaceae bacterium SG7u.111]
MIHKVQPGDTLYQISRKYNISTSRILELNKMNPYDTIYVGQELIVSEEKKQTSTASTQGGSSRPFRYYSVKPGDSLYSISKKFNTSPEKIVSNNNLTPSQPISIGQQLVVDAGTPSVASGSVATRGGSTAPPSGSSSGSAQYHTVQAGESLYAISKKYGTTPALIINLNQLPQNASIYVGQKLVVTEPRPQPQTVPTSPHTQPTPVVTGAVYTVQRGDSLYAIAQRFHTTPQKILAQNGLAPNATIYIGQILKVGEPQTEPPKVTPEVRSYSVQAGDTLSKIANQFSTVPQEIMRINNLATPALYVGQKLILPTSQPVPQPTTTTTSGPTGSPNVVTQAPISFPSSLSGKAEAIKKARAIYQLQAYNGIQLFGNGIVGPVGRINSNNPADLEKVQQRLVQLKMLTQAHGEAPSQLQARIGNAPISYAHIPRTVKAIELFQQKKRVDYWTKKDKHVKMMGTNKFTRGLVAPDDITYKMLREYTDYKLSFPHPTSRGQMIVAEFNNFVRSSYNEYYNGVGYSGEAPISLSIDAYKSLGLDESMALALQYVSKHEGNCDAINTYDKANFSWGFIQFAGKGGGSNGSLGAVIATMKARQPQLFAEYFQKIGIDVDVIMRNNEIHDGNLKVFDLYKVTGKVETEGLDAEIALKNDKQLYGAFLRAGYNPAFQMAQLERAVIGYVRPALSVKTDINAGPIQLRNVPLASIIRSPMGNGMMVDLTVNQWINNMSKIFVAAIERVAGMQRMQSPQQLQMIDERLVVQSIRDNAGADERIKTRANSILNSSLSPVKPGGVPPPV